MGYAIAASAAGRGHAVRLVSGPVSLASPDGVAVSRVGTAAQMLAAVEDAFLWCDVLVMSAAVADWKPKAVSGQKLKKASMSAVLELEPTVDILRTVAKKKTSQLVVGFAAETENVVAQAHQKRIAKGLDLVVANDVSRTDAGFEVDTNAVTFVTGDGEALDLPLMSKVAVAEHLLDWIEKQRGQRPR
jgi:phosphopantothenoylcysteine decarboxylase / phosphopantothenate---cysteine ligase